MLHTLRIFSSKFRLFHNATFFGSCIIHILYTECAKIKKKKIRRQRVKLVRPRLFSWRHASVDVRAIRFPYDSFVKSGESIIETQWLFLFRSNIGRHGNIPSRNTILRWVTSFRARGTIMKNKTPGPVANVRTPENVERFREAVVRSPTRSARRHAVELGMRESAVRKILQKDLGFHPYKMMIVQTSNEGIVKNVQPSSSWCSKFLKKTGTRSSG